MKILEEGVIGFVSREESASSMKGGRQRDGFQSFCFYLEVLLLGL